LLLLEELLLLLLLLLPALAFAVPSTPQLLQQYLATMAVELGPNGDDTLFFMAAFDRANLVREPTDHDLAVVGGTGRYKGAMGEVVHSGTRFTVPDNLYVAEIAVPKFKRF
jgi:hypothetical protein